MGTWDCALASRSYPFYPAVLWNVREEALSHEEIQDSFLLESILKIIVKGKAGKESQNDFSGSGKQISFPEQSICKLEINTLKNLFAYLSLWEVIAHLWGKIISG